MYDIQELKARIVPVPKKLELTQGEELKLTSKSKFCVTIPDAEYGPLVGAREKLSDYLERLCGPDCFAEDGVKIAATVGNRPADVKHSGG